MSDKPEMTNDVLLAEALIRISVLESILITAGITTAAEIDTLISILTERVSKLILSKIQSSSDLNSFMDALTKKSN